MSDINKQKLLQKLWPQSFRWKRMLASIIFVYVGVMVGLYLMANHMMFPAPTASYELRNPFFTLPVGDDEHIAALHLKNSEARYTLLYSHGNADDIGALQPILKQYPAHGFSIFAYDYRGYGCSSGGASEKNTYEDIRAAYTYLTEEEDIPPEQIIALGRSIGSGPTLKLAREVPLGGIILESPFVSASRVLTKIPLFPLDRFRNLTHIRQINEPILIVHGTDDHIIPPWHGKKLYKAAPSEQKQHLWAEGAGHNGLMQSAGEEYWQTLRLFTDQIAD